MYCKKCHKQSPDNFECCAYCSAPFEKSAEKKPDKFIKKNKKKKTLSRKNIFIGLVVVAICCCVAAIVTGVLTGSKPETVVKNLCIAIEDKNSDGFYSLYDSQIKEYKKANRYFNDDETFKAMTEPLEKSIAFYGEKCGESFNVSYKINTTDYLTEKELEYLNKLLQDTYGYTKLPSDGAKIDFEIDIKGETGEYKSVYNDFYCIKIGGKWYKIDIETSLLTEKS